MPLLHIKTCILRLRCLVFWYPELLAQTRSCRFVCHERQAKSAHVLLGEFRFDPIELNLRDGTVSYFLFGFPGTMHPTPSSQFQTLI